MVQAKGSDARMSLVTVLEFADFTTSTVGG